MDGTNGTSPGYPDPDLWRDLPPLSGPCGRTDPPRPTRSLPDYNPNKNIRNLIYYKDFKAEYRLYIPFILIVEIFKLIYDKLNYLKYNYIYKLNYLKYNYIYKYFTERFYIFNIIK